MTKTHARFSPSKLSRIMACPGSVQLCDTLPSEPESEYAAEGTYLHNLIERVIKLQPLVKNTSPDYAFLKTCSHEQRNIVIDCWENLKELILDKVDNPVVLTEKKVKMRDTLGDHVYGTVDCTVISDTQIHIIDFKFGAGVEVSVYDNPQLLAYLDGFLNWYGDEGSHELFVWVFQPRLYKYECCQVTRQELKDFVNAVSNVVTSVLLTDSTNRIAPLNPGDKQCRWCAAGGVCKARLTDAQEKAIALFEEYYDNPMDESGLNTRMLHTVSNEDLAKLLSMEERITSAFKAIREHLFGQLLLGQEVPGYKLVSGRSTRRWADDTTPSELFSVMPESVSIDDIYSKPELLSPAKMEKLLPSKQRKNLEPFIIKVEGAPTMVKETSTKQALTLNSFNSFVGYIDKV